LLTMLTLSYFFEAIPPFCHPGASSETANNERGLYAEPRT
jgi:hypothetical protein